MKKHLWVVPVVLLLCFVVNCQDKAAMAELEKCRAQTAVEEQNKALAIRCADAFQKGDVAAIKDIFSPNYFGHLAKITVHTEETHSDSKHFDGVLSRDVLTKSARMVFNFESTSFVLGRVG